MRVRQIKLFAAVETDLVRPAFDGEHAAHVTVATAERELEDPTQRVHRSFDRVWREQTGLKRHSSAASEHSLMECMPPGQYPHVANDQTDQK